MVLPSPYFVRKILVFFNLQVGLRCKILKTMKFHAKSSRIRSYGEFHPLLAVPGRKEAQRLLGSLCNERGK
jgi:hypothetical protein